MNKQKKKWVAFSLLTLTASALVGCEQVEETKGSKKENVQSYDETIRSYMGTLQRTLEGLAPYLEEPKHFSNEEIAFFYDSKVTIEGVYNTIETMKEVPEKQLENHALILESLEHFVAYAEMYEKQIETLEIGKQDKVKKAYAEYDKAYQLYENYYNRMIETN